jgi:proteasome accessory factor C
MSRTSAESRLRRILALLPWVIAQPGGAPVVEVCRRFGIDRKQLMTELGLLWMVGVHPYTPHELIDWEIDDDDRLTIHLADWFVRPLRLTPDQALSLLVTGRGMAELPGADPEGPLARGLAKVAGILGLDPASIDVDLGAVEADLLATLREAIDQRLAVEISYYTYGRDEHTQRVVEPWRVFSESGQWYLEGYCRTNEARRTFRVDRIDVARTLAEHFDAPPDPEPAGPFTAGPDDPRVTLRLVRSARWVAESYPVENVEELPDGHLEITLAVTARPWFERLLLRLGTDARIVDAPAGWRDAAVDAARRTLAVYRTPGGTPG